MTVTQALSRFRSYTLVAATTRDHGLARSAADLMALSQESFGGWSTRQFSRYWEYPWVLRQVTAPAIFKPGERAADIGAGMSPLPIALKRSGYDVTVVDPGPDVANSGTKFQNEWDWVDYGKWGIRCIRMPVEEAKLPVDGFSIAVSVSVIEHLTSDARRGALQAISSSLRVGGLIVLTLDLVPGTRDLWNRILGKQVEASEAHGSVDSLIAEAEAAGLTPLREVRCPVPGGSVDVVGLVLSKS